MPSYDYELEIALAAARNATDYLREAYDQFVVIPDAPVSISTEADKASQDLILNELSKVFPSDAYCAEEPTQKLQSLARQGDRIWVIDPIDGTRGFARKNGQFSVMIALFAGGEPVVGVVAEPALNRYTFAKKFGGTFFFEGANLPRRCRVNPQNYLSECTLVQSHAKGKPQLGEIAFGPKKTLQTYSAGIKMALVARGEADIYLNDYSLFHDWDIMAGHILVTEAGGRVTTISGNEIQYLQQNFDQSEGLIASNGLLHEAALNALRQVPYERRSE
ncbi:MAG: 3'(2'),5'-bisphosphate nucleotidase CysQ [Gemmataceae bacterium]|jgi:3'(2'), 5'-bisphosphate nucleotidase|nr:3'(2'),5'-bisphosphate nucleotidase CysQ [Gemmataceae bacterium]